MDKKYFPDMIIEKPRLDGGRTVSEYAQNQTQTVKPKNIDSLTRSSKKK